MELNQSTFDAAFLNGSVGCCEDDCKTIRDRAGAVGIRLTLRQAFEVWRAYSQERCAGWLMNPTDDTVRKALEEFIVCRLG